MSFRANFIDPLEIPRFLDDVARDSQNAEELSRLLKVTLGRALSKEKQCVFPVDAMPEDAPEWLRAKWGRAAFCRFVPDQELRAKVEHVRDWLLACSLRNAPWLENVDDKGRPRKLLKIGSLEQAIKEADKDLQRQRQQNKDSVDVDAAFEDEITQGGIAVVKVFDDGYRMVRILNKVAAKRESYLMRHCIGNGAYDSYLNEDPSKSAMEFYSLRDTKNQPHVTMQVCKEKRALRQCAGKRNYYPAAKYKSYVEAFICEFTICCDSYAAWLGFVFHGGQKYMLDSLPDDYTFNGTLDISHMDDFTCPKNLTVDGHFALRKEQRALLKPCLKVGLRIREDEKLDCGRIKCTVYSPGFKDVLSHDWYISIGEKYQYHREDGPARIEYDAVSGKVIAEKWYHYGHFHRMNGPAFVKYNHSGKVIVEQWFESNRLHRVGGPALIEHDSEGGELWIEKWYDHARLHRLDGPAYVEYKKEESSKIHCVKWYMLGRLHRIDGPAIERWRQGTDEKIVELWYENGVRNKEKCTFEYGVTCIPQNVLPAVFTKKNEEAEAETQTIKLSPEIAAIFKVDREGGEQQA